MAFDFDELDDEDLKTQPIFVGWYSGGFHQKDGEALLEPLMSAVQHEFPQMETMFLHFPDAYGMTGEGRDPWPAYVDRLVEEIDKEPSRTGRPLILFGHSRGNAPAMTLAKRLGPRVLKVYIASSAAPVPGDVSPFETLSLKFKETGDIGLLQWFVSLNPGNLMMENMCKSVMNGEMAIEDSPYLNAMITLMRTQYKDAMYPDMERDFKGVASPLFVFGPRQDPGCPYDAMQLWSAWTSGDCKVKMLSGVGHMDCLQPAELDGEMRCPLWEVLLKDLALVLADS